MTLGQRFKVLFNKRHIVRIYIFGNDRRIGEHYVIPDKDNTVTIDNKKYTLTQDAYHYQKGIPTYIFADNKVTPVNIFDVPKTDKLTAEDFKSITDSKIIQQIVDEMDDESAPKELLILGGAMLLGFVVLGYLMMTSLEGIEQMLQEIINRGGFE